MKKRILNFALTLTLLSGDLCAGRSVSVTKNDLTVTVRSLSSRESKTLFGRDLLTSRIYPICLSIRNQKDIPVSFSIKDVQVLGANVLTTASIQSSIASMYVAGCVFLIICFPISFLMYYGTKWLTEQLAMVAEHGFTNDMVTIQPGEVFETFAFPEYRSPETVYLKDANGKRLCDENGKELPGTRPPFVAPTFIDTVVTCSTSTAWFNVSFELSAPV